jgi:hypothetical protein
MMASSQSSPEIIRVGDTTCDDQPSEQTGATDAQKVIGTILKHDTKVTSYKIALLRAINDVALSFPDLQSFHRDVAVPLRMLAEFWIAYYWPFVSSETPILQGVRAKRHGKLTRDMSFRSRLTTLRAEWEKNWQTVSSPSDGFLIINEFRIPRKRSNYPMDLLKAYDSAISTISSAIQMPIRYAGPGQWTVFEKPLRYSQLRARTVAIPKTQGRDFCLVIPVDLWRAFQQMSLYVEALCIHEWCLFTERVDQEAEQEIDRGQVYRLLTDRPDNRRPLTWERNQVDLLLMEDREFTCPWTERRIRKDTRYDMDHLLPVSVYPINEMWNLVPSDPDFNSHTKRDRLPTYDRLAKAEPHLREAYTNYETSPALAQALREDVRVRFSTVQVSDTDFPLAVAKAVTFFIDRVADSRSLVRF